MTVDDKLIQTYILLNVPARQSRNYYDYIKANIPNEYLIYVDALFGGLDVSARIKCESETERRFMTEKLSELVEKKGLTKESAILSVYPFIDKTAPGIEENFILVVISTDEDMRDPLHQKAFISFLERNKIINRVRFAATISESLSVDSIPIPSLIERHQYLFASGKSVLLELSVDSLDDPRDLVMRNLQNFSDVVSTRTFFGANFAKEENTDVDGNLAKIALVAKGWASPLLNWRRLFGI